MERNEDGVRRKRPGGETSRRRKRESSGSGGSASGWRRRRERKCAEVKAGSRRRSGAGAAARSGAGWTGSVSATSEAATTRGSASAGGAGGVTYHGREAGCGDSAAGGRRGRERRALRIAIGGAATWDWPSGEGSRREVVAVTERAKFEEGNGLLNPVPKTAMKLTEFEFLVNELMVN
jgi:hypothetical protein